MNFRNWLNEEYFTTGHVMVNFRERPYSIYRNPTNKELLKVIKQDKIIEKEFPAAGGILTADGDVYIWPRVYDHHGNVENFLGIKSIVGFYVNQQGQIDISDFSTRDYDIELIKVPAIQAMMQKEPIDLKATG